MYFTNEPEHITQLRDTIRRFAAREMPRESVREWDRNCELSMPLFRKLAQLGVCGLTVDEEYVGAGRDLVAACAVIEELAQHGTTMGAAFTHCAFYGGLNIGEDGSEMQKHEWHPRIARGEMLFAYGLSEPDVGCDLASVGTSARVSSDGRHVIINGTQRWCTGARFADLIVCLVKSDSEAPRYRNLSMVLVSPKLPGVTIRDIDHIGIRYAKSTDVTFDDVAVPVDYIIGGLDGWNKGWGMLAGPGLDCEKLEITASALGIATAAVNEAWAYAQERRQFGKPICAHQSVRHALVDARTRLQLLGSARARTGRLYGRWLLSNGRHCTHRRRWLRIHRGPSQGHVALWRF